MYVLLALLLLGMLIMAHEAGHYLAARASGIEVQEFAMGMGPCLLSWKNKNGTQFSLRLFPIGGYCQFYGEDQDLSDPRAFNNQKVWKRFLTVISGPAMNFVVAFLVIIIYLSAIGLYDTIPAVYSVEDHAAAAGLMAGDEIAYINGQNVKDPNFIIEVVSQSEGNPVTLTVIRGEEEKDITITPFYDEEAQRYRVGFSFDQARVRVPLSTSIPFSASYNLESATLILDTLKNLVTTGEGADELTGPVGTVYVIQEVTREGGLDIYMQMISVISMNLGVINLLPLPGLDGSRLLFLAYEAVRRKPVKREIEGGIHFAGLVLLLGLMVVLTYKDVMQIFVR